MKLTVGALAFFVLLQVMAQTIEREVKGLAEMFHHHAEWGVVALLAWNQLAQSIPTPGPTASWQHVWFFNVAHLVVGNRNMLGKRTGSNGLLERKHGTGSFTQEELARMAEKK